MQQNFKLLFPSDPGCINNLPSGCRPFDSDVIDFLNELAGSILKDRESRNYPDVVTFAFFCRKANLLKLKEEHNPSGLRLGKGVVFHIAPGNVPVNFGYSMVAGLLAGNSNIVKLSSKEFPQVDLIIRHLHKFASHPAAQRIVLVKYPHESDCNDSFSALADVRVIWGGDNTIAQIRKSKLPPRSYDICFADRYSLCAIDAKSILQLSEKELTVLAENFYNDTFLFDQNACSTPHMILWTGESNEIQTAKTIFWKAFHEYSQSHYNLQAVIAVDKLNALYRAAIEQEAVRNPTPDNLITRAELPRLPENIDKYRCHGGFFMEYEASSLDDIAAIVNRKFQTLSHFGFTHTQLSDFIIKNKPSGIDRIVPVGHTTDFSLVWDGYDLIGMLSRYVSII